MESRTDNFQEEANAYGRSRFTDIARYLAMEGKAQKFGHDEWSELFSTRLDEMPLSVTLEAIYPQRETMEFSILLGTGGPADRVLVTTDFSGEVETATYQYQDWFQPWTEVYLEPELVMAFARHWEPTYPMIADMISEALAEVGKYI